MKNHFIRLFKYDAWANRQMNGLIAEFGDAEQPRRWMAHLLAAQQIWIKRCQLLPPAATMLWPDNSTAEMDAIINTNDTEWLSYLGSLQPEDFDKPIIYKTLKGDGFQNTLSDIIAHVINHGTHHRAQIGQYLKNAGAKLPATDYILFVRDIDKVTL